MIVVLSGIILNFLNLFYITNHPNPPHYSTTVQHPSVDGLFCFEEITMLTMMMIMMMTMNDDETWCSDICVHCIYIGRLVPQQQHLLRDCCVTKQRKIVTSYFHWAENYFHWAETNFHCAETNFHWPESNHISFFSALFVFAAEPTLEYKEFLV